MQAEFLQWYRSRHQQEVGDAEEFFARHPAVSPAERQQLLDWARTVLATGSTLSPEATRESEVAAPPVVPPGTRERQPATTAPQSVATAPVPSPDGFLTGSLEDSSRDWTPRANAGLRASAFRGLPPAERLAGRVGTDAEDLDLDGLSLANRYRVLRDLGAGAFGRVVLAWDTRLEREVAIKIPRRDRFRNPNEMQRYLAEARTVATLDHPRIATVFDVETNAVGEVLIVSKYIDGETLQKRLESSSPSAVQAAVWLLSIAEALEAAHARRVIHRDVKPANVLIERRTDHAYITDFGLAIREDDEAAGRERAGTWPYMSPEQVLGEGHRVDRRSDLYALGVILYECLTRRRPFRGASREELARQIASEPPMPPRSILASIPEELERICLKLLAKRASDRYPDATQLVLDLEAWLKQQSVNDIAGKPEQFVRPRGLESFGEADARGFLELLPGLRNRGGLPDSVAFWVRHLKEQRDEGTFPVGVLFGPSGSGKSSFFKAGVLPQLEDGQEVAYVEATIGDTEARLLAVLHQRFPGHDVSQGVAGFLKQLRMSDGPKLVIVLDQFEQWLHAHANENTGGLVAALRQCNGGRVQAVLLVRDDFAVSLARLMNSLDIPLIEGRNFVLLDLFDKAHARQVLVRFGQGLGKLPASSSEFSEPQQVFLQEAVETLAENGRVVPVRLSLFVEMMKRRAWTPESLRALGDLEAQGVAFLQECLEGDEATIVARRLSLPARVVLACMLPEDGVGIKGSACPVEDLAAAAGMTVDDARFRELIQLLDRDLKLIAIASRADEHEARNAACYQLTHDYLVPSLRGWLQEKQRETRQGRALIALQEHAASWSRRRDPRQLPGLENWCRILSSVPRVKWTGAQHAMMRAATRHHGLRLGLVLGLALMTTVLVRQTLHRQQQAAWHEQLRLVLDSLDNSSGQGVSYILDSLDALDSKRALPVLQRRFNAEDVPTRLGVADVPRTNYQDTSESRRLRLAYALARGGTVEVEFLVSQLTRVELEEGGCYIEALGMDRDASLRLLAERAGEFAWNGRTLDGLPRSREDEGQLPSLEAYQARLATAMLCLGDSRAAELLCAPRADRNQDLTLAFIHHLSLWPGDMAALHRCLERQGSDPLRYAVLLGIGQIEPARVPLAVRSMWRDLAMRWHKDSPKAAIHSGAGWLLRRWGFEEPVATRDGKPLVGRDWYVNSAGMTMVRIPKRERPLSVDRTTASSVSPDEESLWICDREVSQGDLDQFLVQGPLSFVEAACRFRGRGDAVSRQAAAQSVSLYTAMRFCNWLSEREGLTPCYVGSKEPPRSRNDGHGDPQRWLVVPGNGYRLPSRAEWQHACQHGAAREIIQGQYPELIAGYAWFAAQKPTTCGRFMPNPWGLFDMLGNVWELTHDEVPDEPGRVIHLGGGWFNRGPELYSGLMYSLEPVRWSQYLGFRVVRGPQSAEGGSLPRTIE